MGFRERIGLKPKSSSANLSAGLNGGSNGGYGFNASPQHNMPSIPEAGFASGPSQHQYYQQQPRTTPMGGIPMASRPGPQPASFEANRSASSGSTYSFSTNSNAGTAGSNFGSSTTSFTTTSTGTTSSSGFGAGIRNFSGASNKSSSTSKTAQPQQHQLDPQITAADVRRCTKLLRKMFELHLELWTLTNIHGTDQYRRDQKRMQVEAILFDIHTMVGAWNAVPQGTWTEDEYAEVKWIEQTLRGLPPPPY